MAVDTAAYSEQTDLQRDITEMVRQFADEIVDSSITSCPGCSTLDSAVAESVR